MFRTSLLAGLALALIVSMTSSAEAQLRGLRFPPSLQNIFMLRGGKVQEELGINDEQKALLTDLSLQLQQEALEIFTSLQDLNPDEQKEAMPEIMEMISEKGAETQAKVSEILDKSQIERLNELSLQARGAGALEDKEVVAALKLTDEQKKKLADIREEGNVAIQKAFEDARSGGGNRGEIRAKMEKMRKELGEKGMAVLSPEQRQQFEKMKGEKFDFPPGRGFPF